MKERTRHLAAALTGLGLGLAALGPGLAPGFVLSYDMVFVPGPAFTDLTFGLTGIVPRHVPSDAFATALAHVLPADAVQKLVLLAVFVMACTSAASLVPSRRLLPRLAAGVCYAWNPFVAERLLLGQWALLLGYAALPWAVAAAARTGEPGGGRRLVRALLPAAVGGFAALTVTAITALTVALATGGDRARAALRVVAAAGVLSLPWLVPGVLRPAGLPGDGAAVGLFAARADTPFGTLGSLLLLGGVWNGETVPRGYGAPVTATIWLLVVVVALTAYWRWCREPVWWRGAALAAVVGFAVAALGAVAAPVLEGLIGLWPGFAVLRDGQQYAAPLAVVVAVGLGVAADRAAEARWPGVAAAAMAVPVFLLPTLAWGAAGDLRAVHYPDDWARARQIIDGDREPGDVLVLPWASYRSYPWNHGRRVLDPLPRYLHRRVIVDDAVTVGGTTVPPEDPRAVRLAPVARTGTPPAATLREAGVRFVVVDAETGSVRPTGAATPVLRGADLVVYRIDGAAGAPVETVPAAPVVVAWGIMSLVVFWSFLAPGTTLSLPLLGSIAPHSPHHRRRTP
ncbi:transmembrane protein [Mycobacterium tuberculosis]|nr:transmembrane protein [Mycobacterium tuberculosis]